MSGGFKGVKQNRLIVQILASATRARGHSEDNAQKFLGLVRVFDGSIQSHQRPITIYGNDELYPCLLPRSICRGALGQLANLL